MQEFMYLGIGPDVQPKFLTIMLVRDLNYLDLLLLC